jgi:hypothetical protein
MALTVSQQPQAYTPAYNSQVFTALSNQRAVADFKYIVTVQINGGSIFTKNILQRPDGYLVYNPIELVKNYITRSYFDPTSVTCQYAEGKSCTVEVKIKEYYTAAIQSTTTINYIAYDACFKDEDFRNYIYTDYISNGANVYLLENVANEFLVPDYRVDVKNDLWIHFFKNSCDTIDITHSDGVTITVITLAIPATNNYIYYANVGYNTLLANAITPAEGDTVTIEIKQGVTVRYTGSYTFTDLCTKFRKYTIQYLKRNGNIGRFNFEMISNINVGKKSETVRLNPSRIRSGIYSSRPWDAEKRTISTQTTRQITLNTNWLTGEQSESLEECFDSPVRWLVDDNQNYKSITITDTSYKINEAFGDPLFFYKVEAEFDIQETRQRGI